VRLEGLGKLKKCDVHTSELHALPNMMYL
jgi:hypothetical protein